MGWAKENLRRNFSGKERKRSTKDIAIILLIGVFILAVRFFVEGSLGFGGYFILASLAFLLSVLLIGLYITFGDVTQKYQEPQRSKAKLEIRSKDGVVLASDIDPSDIQKIAKIVEEAKGDSR